MSNYSDKSDVDCNLNSNYSTFNHLSSSEQFLRLTNPSKTVNSNINAKTNGSSGGLRSRTRSRSPVSKSRSRSVSDRSLSPQPQHQAQLNQASLSTITQMPQHDSYRRSNRNDQSPPSRHLSSSRPHQHHQHQQSSSNNYSYHSSSSTISKKRERSLTPPQRYSSSRRRPSSPANRRRSRSRTPSSMSYLVRYGRRPSPPVHYNSNFNGRHHDLIDRFNPPENEILAIFGLSKRANEQDLLDLYKNYGCKECKIIIDKHTGCPKGYGFVYFGRVRDAIVAKKETDGKLLLNKPMRVDYSIGERDFNQSAHHNNHHYSSSTTSSYSKSNGYTDHNNNHSTRSSSSRYNPSSSSSADYYRRDQRAPLPSRELMITSRERDHYRNRSRSATRQHISSRYVSPPPTPPQHSSRFNSHHNDFYAKSDERSNRRISPARLSPPTQTFDDRRRNIYRRGSPPPPPPPPPPRSRSRSLDRQRRYNNDHMLDSYMPSSYGSSSSRNNGTSGSVPRFNEMISRRPNRI